MDGQVHGENKGNESASVKCDKSDDGCFVNSSVLSIDAPIPNHRQSIHLAFRSSLSRLYGLTLGLLHCKHGLLEHSRQLHRKYEEVPEV